MSQGSVLGPLFFLIYINDLPDNLESNHKIFTGDTSFFYRVFDKHVSRSTLITNKWAFQWKMQFNPDPNKQAQELYFSKKAGKHKPLDLTLNKSNYGLLNTWPCMSHLKAKIRSSVFRKLNLWIFF